MANVFPIKPLVHSPLRDLYPQQKPQEDSIVNFIGKNLIGDEPSDNHAKALNALYATLPYRAGVKPYSSGEDLKNRGAEDYANTIQNVLWIGGMAGGYYSPLFDLANAAIYESRNMPGDRNAALLSAFLPTIVPKKLPGNNPVSNFLNKYIVPKHGDDLLRDVVRGKSTKTLGEYALSGNIGQSLYRPFVGRMMTNIRPPFQYSNIFRDVAKNLKNTPEGVGKGLWKALVKDEPIISAAVKPGQKFMDVLSGVIPRHFLHREMYDLPLKPYKIPGTSKSISWDEVFKLAKNPKESDNAFSVKGKLWEFNKDNMIGKHFADEWDKAEIGYHGHAFHSVLGRYGTEGNERMFDIWDFDLNPGEKMFDNPVNLLRGIGQKLDLWDPVKVVQDMPLEKIIDTAMPLEKRIYADKSKLFTVKRK